MKFMIAAISLLAQTIFIGALCALDQQAPSSTNSTSLVTNNQTTTAEQSQLSTAKLDTKPEANATLAQSLSERLVRESSLQAEESRPAPVSLLPAPQTTGNNDTNSPQRAPRQLVRNVASYYSPSSFSGGSGNSYMSLSRDGSNRYEFGFDTEAAASGDLGGQSARGRREPRLMREETRLEDGTVLGRYGYTDPFNVFRIVQYVAGPEGYFATEDVGSSAAGAKFQLNKQLAKRLEEARAQRLRARRRSTRPPQPEANQPEAREPARPLESAASLVESQRAPAAQAEVLVPSASGPAAQPFRYATKINHVLGANGVSYATAFRPVPVRAANAAYQPIQPPSSEALQRQHLHWEERRSKLPAPIYTPSMAQGAQYAPEAERNQQQVETGQASSVLESSPAWNLLNNNYQQQTSSLFIDHLGPPEATLPGPEAYQSVPAAKRLGQGIEENFRREAALLQALRKPPSAMAYNYNQNYNSKPAQSYPEFKSSQFGVRATPAVQQQWPRPEADQPAPPPPPPSYSSLALNQFDPPLYSPEVHEESRPAGQQAEQPVVYSSTIIHSEVAAERDYRPQRLSSRPEPAREVDLERESSSDRKLVASAAAKAILLDPTRHSLKFDVRQSADHSPDAGKGKALIIDHAIEKSPLEREESPQGSANLRASAEELAEPAIVKYATRLTGLRQQPLPADLSVEDSEQISSVLKNGTSRAKLPDRSKKLSSIFKARTPTKKFGRVVGSTGNSESLPEAAVTTTELTPAVAAKKRPNLREGSTTTSTSTSTPASEPVHEEPKITEASSEAPAEPKPTAMVVDATNPSSNMDRELYEKIVKIQREIAAMNQANSTAASATPEPIQALARESVISRESSTKELAVMQKNETSAAVEPQAAPESAASSTLASVPEVSTVSGSQEIRTNATSSASSSSSSSQVAEKSAVEADKPGASATAFAASSMSSRRESEEQKTNAVLTGPLMKMDNFVENGDFLANLTQDMDMFDSVRSSFANQPTTTTSTTTTTTTTTIAPAAASAESSSNSSKVEVVKSVVSELAGQATTLAPSSEEAPDQTVSGKKVKVTIKMVKTRNSTRSEAADSNAAAASGSAIATNLKDSEQSNATVSKQELAVSVKETKKLESNSTTDRPARSGGASGKSQQSRFGRLVIKRGDKVVARFNGSEPIPDSLIPVAGNSSDIIVPDMPRQGLRIAVKRRFQPKASSQNANNSTTSPNVLSSPAPSSARQLSSQPEQPATDASGPKNASSLTLVASGFAQNQPLELNATTVTVDKKEPSPASRVAR